ncbi:MAG: cellulase family glycosylhydrolase, partial [Anaerolineae bacterium]|nr:cellulase family glycosylhydrolase [Anaerolineae bacterium]
MDNPFLQHVGDIFTGLKGRKLIVAAIIWGILLLLALLCVFGVIKLPGGQKQTPEAKTTATPEVAVVTPANQLTTTPLVDYTTLPTPTPTPSNDAQTTSLYPPLLWGDFGYGIAAHAISMPDYTLDQIAYQLGFTWVKQQVRWDHFSPAPGQMDWSGYDVMVEFANERNLKVMLSVIGAPEWTRTYFDDNPQAAPPDDVTQFTNFLGEMVDRYKGKIHAIEVWNEQNLDREWDTAQGVNAASYVEMLRLSYQTIKSRDPNIIVISGALSPTGSSATDSANPNRVIYMDDLVYFQQMVDAGFLNYADC